MDNPVFVTRSKMPEFSEYVQYMSQLFSTRFLTNNGPFCQCLEKNLAKWLNIEHLAVCSNGTCQCALQRDPPCARKSDPPLGVMCKDTKWGFNEGGKRGVA